MQKPQHKTNAEESREVEPLHAAPGYLESNERTGQKLGLCYSR